MKNWTIRQWCLTGFLSLAVMLSSISSVDRYAEADYQSLFQRALVTFALARTLNGLISAAQGTEIALQPAGVGVTLTPGEILDPVNDLIERFSWVMLAATVSLGVQQVLLDIGQWWGARLLVGLSGLLWLWAMIARGTASHQFPAKIEPILMRAFLILIFLRFAVPFALIANETLFEMFMQPKFDESTAVITSAGADIQSASAREQDPITDESFLGTIERMVDSTKESLNLRQRVEYIQQRASDVVEHLIQLAVVFILQSAVLPLVFLWLLINLLKMLIQRQMWRPRHDSNV